MSWICRNCETENSDELDVCEVCETHAPLIVDFQYDKVLSGKPITVRWKTENCDSVSICYKGETRDVSDKESYSIDDPDERGISFLLSNSETTTRTVSFVMDFFERPSITFYSEKSKLRSGFQEQTTLAWNIENARKAYLKTAENKKEVSLVGKLEVSPEVTTIYFLEALALDDESSFIEELQIGVFDECSIDFSSNKEFVFPTLPVVLTWNVTNATKVWLGAEEVGSSGCKMVEPTSDVVYNLKAQDEFGLKEKRILIRTIPIKQKRLLLTSPPNLVHKQNMTIIQPKFNVSIGFPQINIDWIQFKVPLVKSFKDLGYNVELSPPLPSVEFNLSKIIKKIINSIIR